jgi:hypothetical protein
MRRIGRLGGGYLLALCTAGSSEFELDGVEVRIASEQHYRLVDRMACLQRDSYTLSWTSLTISEVTSAVAVGYAASVSCLR